jgi:L-fuculose-phosphate aldolase
MATSEKALRESIIAHGASVVTAGLGSLLASDISARFEDSLLVTPSGANYADLRPAMIALMPLGGEYGAWKGPMKPTSEWRIHLDIVRARPDIGGIVRFQSPYATALAMARKPILAAHSMIALFGAPIVRCAKYAPAGTKELAGLALEALDQGHAVLLSNYCALTTGPTLEAALVRARELETLARLYAITLSLGRPAILSDEEVGRIGERLKSNGVQARIAALAEVKTRPKPPAKAKRVARKRRS